MIEFRALGPIEVWRDGQPVRLGGPKQRALLGVLLVHAGGPVSAARLIDQLWEDDPPPTAATALQVHASGLRKVIGDRLVTAGSGYALDAAEGEVDVRRFEAAVRAARAHLPDRPAQAASCLAEALALWRGEPFGGVPATSDVAAARAWLAELRLAALEDRAEAELGLGRQARVAAELAGPVTEQPTRERLVELYMLALYRAGRPAEAVRAYHRLVQALAGELGVEPGHRAAALAGAIERRDPCLDPPSPVPASASRFIGRRRELAELGRLLGRSRLLTLTGPGGAGKTRLALELARHAAADHPDAVHVVELAAFPPGSSVATRVASLLGVRSRAGEPPQDALARHLGGARALLVLDNCEHLIGSAAVLCQHLLACCSGLRMLATSREPLGVPGEQVWALTGLALPADGDAGPAAACSDAVRLLADRGAAARRGFTVHDGNVAAAVELCQQLDGLPLAIELAAAQLRTLTLEEVTTRLGRRLDLTDRRARTAPERHRTMRAAIDWSYHLLDAEERTAFRRLSVFAGGCTVAAAEQVCELADGHDLLARLVDRSMLAPEPHPDGTRFRMLELVGEYAAQLLDQAGETDRLRRRHADWCVELATAAPPLGGPDQTGWQRRLSAEEPNLRAALAWCLSGGADPAAVLSIASPLWWFWWSRGLMADALGWLRQALAATEPLESAAEPGSGATAEPAEGPGTAAATESDAEPRPPHGPVGRVRTATESSTGTDTAATEPAMGPGSGPTAGADRARPVAAGLRRAVPVPAELRARGLRAAAALARNSGDHATARELGEQSLVAYTALADRAGMAAALNGLCITAHAQRDFAASLRFGERSRQLAEEAGDERGIAAALNNIGVSLRALDQRAEATALFEDALKRFRAIGDPRGEAGTLSSLGLLASRSGNATEARTLALASLALYRDLELVEGQLDALEILAGLEQAAGHPATALRLLTLTGRERERLGSPLFSPDEIADRERTLEQARAALGPRAAPTVAAEAADLRLPDVVARFRIPAAQEATEQP